MGDPAVIAPSEARILSQKVVHLWRLDFAISVVVVAAIAMAAGRVFDYWTVGTVVAATTVTGGIIGAIFWPPAQYRSWSFAVREADVVIRRGVWWRVTSIVPHSRIQHIDTTHGPLERRLGLSSVVLFTAGTVGASITIPGLPAGEAGELRDHLAALARLGEAV